MSAENGLAEPIPKLCALVVASAFDLAIHDAFGKVNEVNAYRAYGPEYMDRDLSHYLGEDFKGEWLDRYLRTGPASHLHLYHSVGASDPLDSPDRGPAVEDGLPQTLAEWIAAEGLTHFKVKLNGGDLGLDVDRIVDIERVVSACLRKRGGREWKYSLDFNEGCRDVDYLLDFLKEIERRAPSVTARLQYVEQPTSRNLAGPPRILLHRAAREVPLVADEALVDLDSLRLARQVGYSGVALKTCKGQSQSLLLAAAAQKYGAYLCVQDLTCPGLSLVHSAGLAAHLPGVHALEANSRQYIPSANRRWKSKFPSLFRITDGRLGTGRPYRRRAGDGVGLCRNQFFEVFDYGRLRPVPVSDHLAQDDALLVHDIGLGDHVGAIEFGDFLLEVGIDSETEGLLLEKGVDRLPGTVHAEGDDLQPGLVHLLAEGLHGGHFLQAGRTPGGPEIDQNHLAPEVAQAVHLAGPVLHFELGRRPVENHRPG